MFKMLHVVCVVSCISLEVVSPPSYQGSDGRGCDTVYRL